MPGTKKQKAARAKQASQAKEQAAQDKRDARIEEQFSQLAEEQVAQANELYKILAPHRAKALELLEETCIKACAENLPVAEHFIRRRYIIERYFTVVAWKNVNNFNVDEHCVEAMRTFEKFYDGKLKEILATEELPVFGWSVFNKKEDGSTSYTIEKEEDELESDIVDKKKDGLETIAEELGEDSLVEDKI